MRNANWTFMLLAVIVMGACSARLVRADAGDGAAAQLGVLITPLQDQAAPGEALLWRVEVTNVDSGPLSAVRLIPAAPLWAAAAPTATIQSLLPGETAQRVIGAVAARGGGLVPLLEVRYTTADGEHALLASAGQTLRIVPREGFLGRISPDLAVALGTAAIAVAVWLFQTWRERYQRRRLDEERVAGLLQMAAFAAELGAEDGAPVDLGPLEKLFDEEGLYAALTRHDRARRLARQVQAVWEAARRHNGGLERSGGSARAAELQKQALCLRKHLDKQRGPSPRSG